MVVESVSIEDLSTEICYITCYMSWQHCLELRCASLLVACIKFTFLSRAAKYALSWLRGDFFVEVDDPDWGVVWLLLARAEES